MIILDEKSKSTIDLRQSRDREGVSRLRVPTTSSLAPPPYANGRWNASTSVLSTSTSSSPETPTGSPSSSSFIQRSNHLYLTRSVGSIKGSWLIDTSLVLPPALLPTIDEGSTRKNLKLHAKEGKISARIEVQNNSLTNHDSPSDQRASLLFRADQGSIKLRLRRLKAPLMHVSCQAAQGNIILYLPNDFQGPIKTHAPEGAVFLSPAVQTQSTTLLDNKSRRTYFIGTCPAGGLWHQGDEVEIDARQGKVTILFVDERINQKMVRMEEFVNNIKNDIKQEGVAKYMGRMLQVSMDKTREKLASSMEQRIMKPS